MSSLLKSWIAIEFLSTSNEIDTKDKNIIELTSDNYPTDDKKSEWKGYKIKIATFKTADIYDLLSDIFEDVAFADRNPYTVSYTCEFEIDKNEKLNEDSIAISSFPWAVSQLQKKIKPNNWESDFQKFKEDLWEKIIEIFKTEDKNLFEKAKAIESYIETELNWEPYILHKTYFAKIKKIGEDSNDILLNSFYTKDLTMLNQEYPKGWNKSLTEYVNQQGEKKRINLREHSEVIKNGLRAGNIPQGSWASSYSLSLMQQFAVNHIVNNLANSSGYFSVNGPPGTGKTTLLKDVIAAIIVKRAKILSSYKNPSDAFKKENSYPKTGNYNVYYYKPDTKICDDAIIVASSNNAAVENISKELPKKDGDFLKNNFYPENIYFKEMGEILLGEDAWNCISFALGNSSNRSKFISIWESWNNETKSYDKPFQEAIESLDYTITDWTNARQEFNRMIEDFESLKQDLEKNETFLSDKYFIELQKNYNYDPKNAVTELEHEISENKKNIQNLLAQKIEAEKTFERTKEIKPVFWHFWFSTKSAKSYYFKINEVTTEIDDIKKNIIRLQKRNEKINLDIKTFRKYQTIKSEYKDYTPDQQFWNDAFEQTPSKSQELSPWFNSELKAKSIAIFFKALELQTIFISLASKEIKANIELLVCHFSRKIATINGDDLKGIWNTLFLLIPVISTTFASVSNLFKRLGKDTFGWLFIDEAGQAIPQAAASAIYRCKRVIAVGDPLQIEPVVTLPQKVFDYIGTENKISSTVFSSKVSVQTFYDNINPYGSYISEGLWVGSPLKIHRRCADPMFRIANDIAYDNIMQNANRNKPLPRIGNLYSRYDDIKGSCTIRQFVPQQGVQAIKLIEEYFRSLQNQDEFSLFVITPFKAVASEFRKQVKKGLPIHIYQQLIGKIGTVHTFQGKEADVVIFLSGCDESKKGAIYWADSSPNLLNVALTRAKKVFIAIGEKKLYKNTRYFSKMIKELDKVNHS